MCKRFCFLLSVLCLTFTVQADLLDDILDNRFAAHTLSAAQIDSALNGIPSLTDEERLLPQNRYCLRDSDRHNLFRHSFAAHYSIYDAYKQQSFPISDTLIRDVRLSPNGQYAVYGRGQNLYIYKVLFKTEVPITQETGDVFSGISDWLYEEEFGITCLFAFSPDSRQVAFVRLDETQVPVFSWPVYTYSRYPGTESLRYPLAGYPNAQASVCVYDISTKTTRTMRLPEMEEAYIPRIYWRNEQELVIQRINRDQNSMQIFSANPKSTVCTPLYSENSDTYYIDYALFDQWQWLSDGRLVVVSEKDGWRRLYLYSAQGIEQQALTPSGLDVTDVYGVDEKSALVYYEAAPTPAQRQAYAVSLKKGAPVRLTTDEGMHHLTLSADYSKAVDCYQSVSVPNRYTLYDLRGTRLAERKVLLDNADVLQAWQKSGLPTKQFVRIPTSRGDTLDAWILNSAASKPLNGAASKPIVIMQYSGPASQTVLNRWRNRFGHYLAAQGYIVVNADPRGTDCRGRRWRNATYMNLGQLEAEDHLDVARYAQTLPGADPNRIAMIGWSYGGYQTIRTMMQQDTTLIRCGIAIAPVTDWRLYDSGYTERYMRRPQVNEAGYRAADLTAMADRLKGQLLLVHATGDDNVHLHNTLLLSDALVRAGKQFDMQLYVDDNHSLLNKNNKRHLHDKILLYLQQNLRL